MRVEVLVSTMSQEDTLLIDLINRMNISSDSLIINQTDHDANFLIELHDQKIRVISSKERGLSRSRNVALENATGDICVIADDDITYEDRYQEIIQEAYQKHPSMDIIVFALPSQNIERSKEYPSTEKRIGYLRSMRVYSYEITFRRSSIARASVSFNELFGAGSGKYSCGEENIFLFNCLRKGIKILYVPKQIGVVSHSTSTWFKGYDSKFFFDKGAMFYAMSKSMAFPFVIQYLLRKRKLYKGNLGFHEAIKNMMKGLFDCKNEITKRIENRQMD